MGRKIMTEFVFAGRGASLVELIIVVAALIFLALLINNLPSSVSSISRSRRMSIAREIVERKVEQLRRTDFNGLANGTEAFTDANLSSLPAGSGKVVVEDCPTSICTQSEKIKKIKAVVFWNESGQNDTVEVETFISQGGLGQ